MSRLFLHAVLCASALALGFNSHANGAVVYQSSAGVVAFARNSSPATTISAADYSGMIAGDISPVSGYVGDFVSSVTFTMFTSSLYNTGFVEPDLRFYAADGPGSGPGTLLYAFSGPVTRYVLLSMTPRTVILPSQAFALPAGTFWAGLVFDDAGLTPNSAEGLPQTEQAYAAGSPKIGSTSDTIFASTASGQFLNDDPVGTFINTQALPPGQLEWTISVAPVPEPASISFLLAAAMLFRGRSEVKRRSVAN